jgi:hypothetical protein
MASRKLTDRLIDKSDIKEELGIINESNVDFVTKSGKVYCYYGNNKYLPKSVFQNKENGYYYVSIKSNNGKQIQRRIHILVAKAFIKKKDESFNVVMHKDNDKSNNNVENLMWGTVSMNTKQAFDDKLIINDKGFEDSQSFPVIQFDANNHNIIEIFGSMCLAENKTGITKTAISHQANHKVKNTKKKPKCGFYFRFLNEYLKEGFVL